MSLTSTREHCTARIPWDPWSSRDHIPELIGETDVLGWPFDSSRHEYWGPAGRWLLGSWLGRLGLDRTDVITILTTSQEQYVSICVSVTAFNHAAVARVVTDRTRVIIMIHEFGYVDAAFPGQCHEWRDRGIMVLEDCAHVAGMAVGAAKVGDYGDAALFSLPKIIPSRFGGLLRTCQPLRLPTMNQTQAAETSEGKAAAERSLRYISRLNTLREERHRFLRQGLGLPPLEPPQPTVSVPWWSMYLDEAQRIDTTAFPNVCWGGATLEPNRIQIPTNPLVPLSEYASLVAHVQSQLAATS
jgi:hypothetical protein